MERQPHRPQAKRCGLIHQPHSPLGRAAELAAQRPVGPGGPHQQADIDLRAGRMLGDLLQLHLRIRRKERYPGGMGKGDVAGAFHRIAERDMRRLRAKAQAKLDFAARGGIEPAALTDQRLDHLARGVRLDRVVDVGAAKTRLQRAVIPRHDGARQHQRGAVERVMADEIDKGRGCKNGIAAPRRGIRRRSWSSPIKTRGIHPTSSKRRRYRRYVNTGGRTTGQRRVRWRL